MKPMNIAILGDSRAFDTYYVNAAYGSSYYGYDRTFPFLLRKALLTKENASFDVVHIPDHFRAGTIQNNIIRLALTNPALVVLCDGIWETLVNKELYVEYATRLIREHEMRSGKTLDLSFNSRILADLFTANKLRVSPAAYAERQRRIVSYFRRRRRQCIWLTVPTTPSDHLDRLHYAGNYRCIPEWGQCLMAINEHVAPVMRDYGAIVVDLHAMILENGGYGANLIDQWHFSAGFHIILARRLKETIEGLAGSFSPSAVNASEAFMMPRPTEGEPLVLFGSSREAADWRSQNPNANVVSVVDDIGAVDRDVRIVLLLGLPEERQRIEVSLLRHLPSDAIIVYPEELGPIDNPLIGDRPDPRTMA